jgi:hypothetical protein
VNGHLLHDPCRTAHFGVGSVHGTSPSANAASVVVLTGSESKVAVLAHARTATGAQLSGAAILGRIRLPDSQDVFWANGANLLGSKRYHRLRVTRGRNEFDLERFRRIHRNDCAHVSTFETVGGKVFSQNDRI